MATAKFQVGNFVIRKDGKGASIPRKISNLNCSLSKSERVLFEGGGAVSLEELYSSYKHFKPKFDKNNAVKLLTVDNGLKVILKRDWKHYVSFYGVDIPITDDFTFMCYDFDECDGYSSGFLFENRELEQAMVAAGFATKTTRGSYGRTTLFRRVHQELIDTAKKARELEPDLNWTPTPENIENLPEPIREYILSLQAKVVN